MRLDALELERYSRHIHLEGFGPAAQLKLKEAAVLVVGAGGLGSPLLLYLAATGIGKIGIIDNDKVELSNLTRQILFDENCIGKNKAVAAADKLSKLNSTVFIKAYTNPLLEGNALALIKDYTLISDCSDNFATRYLINDVCFSLNKPFVSGAILSFEGQVSSFQPQQTACYRCLYPTVPPTDIAPSCVDNGVLNVLPGVIGLIQATEIIKILTGLGRPLFNNLLSYDALNMDFDKYSFKTNPLCPVCVQHKPFYMLDRPDNQCKAMTSITANELKKLLQQEDPLLLDVREPFEHNELNIGGINIPLAQLEETYNTLPMEKEIIIYCKRGIRSQQAYNLLKQKGFTNLQVLAGGILAWQNDCT